MIYIYLFVILPITAGILIFIPNWVTNNRPKLRPYVSILASFISAYAASFLFDMIIQLIENDLIFKNILFPSISWGLMSLGLFLVAKELATRRIDISIGFYVLGVVAIFASFIGHFYNLYVGLLLLLIGLLSSNIKMKDKVKR